jgi:hypothetical protein
MMVASDILVAGSNGTKQTSFGGADTGCFTEAVRTALSTGPSPPSELAPSSLSGEALSSQVSCNAMNEFSILSEVAHARITQESA